MTYVIECYNWTRNVLTLDILPTSIQDRQQRKVCGIRVCVFVLASMECKERQLFDHGIWAGWVFKCFCRCSLHLPSGDSGMHKLNGCWSNHISFKHNLHCSFHQAFKNLCPLMLLAFRIKSHQKFKITNVIHMVHNHYGNLLCDCKYLLLLQLFSLGGGGGPQSFILFLKKINEGATLIGPSPIFFETLGIPENKSTKVFPFGPPL